MAEPHAALLAPDPQLHARLQALLAAPAPARGVAGAVCHAPAPLLLQLLRRLRAARERAEAMQAEAPQWLRESVTHLAGALVDLRAFERGGGARRSRRG